MKKSIVTLLIIVCVCVVSPAYAQTVNEDVARGKVVWEQLLSEERMCQDLSDGDFSSLGAYLTSLFSGTPYGALDDLIQTRMAFGEKQALFTGIGKRLSECDVAAPFPPKALAFSPLQQMPIEYDRSFLVILQLVVVAWVAFAVVSIVVAFKILIHCLESYFLTTHPEKHPEKKEAKHEVIQPQKMRKSVRRKSVVKKKEQKIS
ncbi:MAG: hypothetical protein Q7R79_00135 [bacterium]|nr:hypothetical protein [bacterium]